MNIIFPEIVCRELRELGKDGIYLEGSILKVIRTESEEFSEYITLAKEQDALNRKKRLEVTKQIQDKNKELLKASSENERLMTELKDALQAAQDAKKTVENDLDVLQKKTQFELIGNIVDYALYVIVGTGIITTALYVLAMYRGSSETTLIGNTWSNLFGILLTNSFSIIGTIMGVKYAQEKEKK